MKIQLLPVSIWCLAFIFYGTVAAKKDPNVLFMISPSDKTSKNINFGEFCTKGGDIFCIQKAKTKKNVIFFDDDKSKIAPWKNLKKQTVDMLVVGGNHGNLDGPQLFESPISFWKKQVSKLLKKGVKAKIVVLDACYTAPFAPVFKPILDENGIIICSVTATNATFAGSYIADKINHDEDYSDIVKNPFKRITELRKDKTDLYPETNEDSFWNKVEVIDAICDDFFPKDKTLKKACLLLWSFITLSLFFKHSETAYQEVWEKKDALISNDLANKLDLVGQDIIHMGQFLSEKNEEFYNEFYSENFKNFFGSINIIGFFKHLKDKSKNMEREAINVEKDAISEYVMLNKKMLKLYFFSKNYLALTSKLTKVLKLKAKESVRLRMNLGNFLHPRYDEDVDEINANLGNRMYDYLVKYRNKIIKYMKKKLKLDEKEVLVPSYYAIYRGKNNTFYLDKRFDTKFGKVCRFLHIMGQGNNFSIPNSEKDDCIDVVSRGGVNSSANIKYIDFDNLQLESLK